MKKVLIIRFSSIGDIVLCSPVIRCLSLQMEVEIHFLCKKGFSTILEAHPHVSKIHTIHQEVKEVLPQLQKEQFDFIIDLHKNIRSLQIRRKLGVKAYSFNKLNVQKWLLVNLKIDRLPRIHLVDRYFEGLKDLNIRYDGQGLDYCIPPSQEIDPFTHFDLNDKKQYIAFAIGAAHATKRLPAQKIIDICAGLPDPIILIGGPGDRETGQQISAALPDQVINACGQLSLHQSASLIRQAAQVISHDTGMMHIAAAFQKPIISIWGNTVPELGMYPFYPKGVRQNQTIEVKGLACRPCSKIGSKQCPKGHFKCMNDIDAQAVVDAFMLKKEALKGDPLD